MELGLREWLIIGGAIVVVLIVLDGWRRMRGGGNNLKMKIDQTMVDLPDDDYNPELPGGGARVLDSDGNPVVVRQEPTLDDLPDVSPVAERETDPLFSSDSTDELSAPRAVSTSAALTQETSIEPVTSSPLDSSSMDSSSVGGSSLESLTGERDPLFEPLEALNDSVSESHAVSEPLAHLDEGISAVRVVPAAASDEPSQEEETEQSLFSEGGQVPLVDTIVRTGSPTVAAEEVADESVVEEIASATLSVEESLVEAPLIEESPVEEAPVEELLIEPSPVNQNPAEEAPVDELFVEESRYKDVVVEVRQEENDSVDLLTEVTPASAENVSEQLPEPETVAESEPDNFVEKLVSEEQVNDTQADMPVDEPEELDSDIESAPAQQESEASVAKVDEHSIAELQNDNSQADDVIVEDDVLDLTFLHEAAAEHNDETDEPVSEFHSEPDSQSYTDDIAAETQAEMLFAVDDEPYRAEEDDLIASLPEGFGSALRMADTADEHDESELDLSRPVSELMRPDVVEPELRQEAMELLSEQVPVISAAATEYPTEVTGSHESDSGIEDHFTAERDPALDFSDLPSLSAVDNVTTQSGTEQYSEPTDEPSDEPFAEAELISPAMQTRPAESAVHSEPDVKAEGQPMQKLPDADKVLVISVVAPKDREAFSGRSLLQILLACGMRYGDMKIFHRYEDGIDQGAIQFSMANAVEPGYFDIDTMERVETRGVTFFMSMEEPRDVMNAYECMLGTAEAVAKNLHGNLLDENRSTMRTQTKEHYRERIRRFEMRKLKQSSGA